MYHFSTPEEELAYRNAIYRGGHDLVNGTITFTDGTTMSISDSVLLENTLTISKQCVDGDNLMFGGVFTDVLKLSVLPDENHENRYLFYDAKIELTYSIKVGEEEAEGEEDPTPIYATVPLGVFYVADAEKPDVSVNLTAYDSITLLDKDLGSTYITGTPWEMFSQISDDTGYPLAFTEQDLTQFVNYDKAAAGSDQNGMKTYRDIVKLLCQMLGCFACDDRTGQLMLKKFSTTPDLTLGDYEERLYPWFELGPADYICSYKGISVTSQAGVFTKVTDNPLVSGIIMVIDDAPAWDYGTETQQIKTDNLYSLLRGGTPEQAILKYTPGTATLIPDPAIDCGDMIEFITDNYNENAPLQLILTSVEWSYQHSTQIESVGTNPYLEQSTPTEDEGGRLLSQSVEKSKLQFISFTNPSEVVVDNTDDQKICECIFTPTTETTALFVGTILVDIDVADTEEETSEETITVPVIPYYNDQETTVTDINGHTVTFSGTTVKKYIYKRDGKCDVAIYYRLGNAKIPSDAEPYIAIDNLEKGEHIITVSYALTALTAYVEQKFEVWITKTTGTTTITLPVRSVEATIFGQEITNIVSDSNITIEENIYRIGVGGITISELTHDEFVIEEDPAEPDLTEPNLVYLNESIIIPDPEEPAIIDDISLYNISGIATKEVTHDTTGEFAPQILQFGLVFMTEDGLELRLEDGITQIETD